MYAGTMNHWCTNAQNGAVKTRWQGDKSSQWVVSVSESSLTTDVVDDIES